MKVRVLFFSLLRDITNMEELEFPLNEPEPPVSHLLFELYEKFEGLREWDEKILVAVNCEYASRDQCLNDNDEVAIMPPVQGG